MTAADKLAVLETARNELIGGLAELKARKMGIKKEHLELIDCMDYGKHGLLVMWNCLDPNHIRYMSSVAVRVKDNVVELGTS